MTTYNGNDSTVPLVLDPVIVEQMIGAEYLRAGYSKVNRLGKTAPDDEKMKAKALELVKGRVVPDKTAKSANSWTMGELYAAVFPGAPGTTAGENIDDLDLNAKAVLEKLKRRVWNLTNPARTGWIQKRLGEHGTLVLCRATVMRGLDEVAGCYVTDDADLIMADSIQPRIEAFVKEAQNLRDHARNDHHPSWGTRGADQWRHRHGSGQGGGRSAPVHGQRDQGPAQGHRDQDGLVVDSEGGGCGLRPSGSGGPHEFGQAVAGTP